jgi:hypothetical protein
MSTRVDILAAKAAFDQHTQQHGCTAAYLRADGELPCPERQALWQAYASGPRSAAGLWAIEPGDAAKVAAQYAWQTELLGQRVQMAG